MTIATVFVLLDTGLTLVGGTWWPAHPGTLAWAVLGVQALACASLAIRRSAPLLVVGVLGAFVLAVTLLISPAGVLTPAHQGNVRAPLATMPAAYGPLFYRPDPVGGGLRRPGRRVRHGGDTDRADRGSGALTNVRKHAPGARACACGWSTTTHTCA
ncbi:hypothetical protein [Streptomyces sp. NPDC001250]|uniref:hypothetical protein n=1 Tax=Streptomyces sp. NPDC001250 TaxID=3154382 RepID=UPI003325BC6A